MTAPERKPQGAAPIDAGAVLNALGEVVIVVGPDNRIDYANGAAEQFLSASLPVLRRQRLDGLLPHDSILLSVIDQVRRSGVAVLESDVTLEGLRFGSRLVSIRAGYLGDASDRIVVSMHERSIAHQIDRQLTHRTAARSVTAMARILAHEIKNPLSGIRGAAQLLEGGLDVSDRKLTELICEEADRIVRLIDRMDVFASDPPVEREEVNIHEVLHHVHELAKSGFAQHVRMQEIYDPSLPSVPGDRDQLVQVFLNLVKNASEAVPQRGGEIALITSYNHGLRVARSGGAGPVNLPLKVTIRDNGAGIPADLRRYLFEPFISTKAHGSGLGLALAAKIIDDHGGIVDVESSPGRTEFRVLLPLTERTPTPADARTADNQNDTS